MSVTNCNCSGFLFFFILYLGSGRNSKDLKKKKKVCSKVSQIFTEIFEAFCPSLNTASSFEAFREGLWKDSIQKRSKWVSHGEQPYCIYTARNLGHMLGKYKLAPVFGSTPHGMMRPRFGWLCGPTATLLILRWKIVWKLTLPGWQQRVTWWCTLSCKIKRTRLWKGLCLLCIKMFQTDGLASRVWLANMAWRESKWSHRN